MIPRERIAYSAIVDRPPLKLPGGARIVVWTIVNLEVWDISRPMARQILAPPTGQTLQPDVPNWSWHEYGMRVGVWRFFKLYERLGIRPTLSINARVCEDYERVARQARDADWEFMGHVWDQGPIHKVPDQRAMIHRSLDTLERFTGKRPVGWLGPGLTQTFETPDLLAEAGIKYIGDWVWDDEPAEITTKHGPLVTLPYTMELNDIPTMMVQHHESPYWLQRCRDAFDRLVRRSPEASVALYSLGNPEILAAATAEIVERLESWDLLGAGRMVLDIGCGIGRLELALAPRVAAITGIDVSPNMIEEAGRRCAGLPNVRLLATSGRDLSVFPGRAFDLVVAVDSFPYLYASGPDLAATHVREAARVLRPGGDLVVLNLSYRGDVDADRQDAGRFAAEAGLAVLRSGERAFRLWDGLAFHLRKGG